MNEPSNAHTTMETGISQPSLFHAGNSHMSNICQDFKIITTVPRDLGENHRTFS